MSLPPKPFGSGVCYIAGKMTGEPDFGRDAFLGARTWWRMNGWKVCDPIEFDDAEYGGPDLASKNVPYETLLIRDLQRINGCDAVVALSNWKDSRGARLEVHWANATGKPVYEAETGATLWDRPEPSTTQEKSTVQENGETRVVSSTGGAKGQKLARFDLMPPYALTCVAEHFGRGARKYSARNWERGYDWSLCFAALQRHLWAWWGGETIDPETQSNHMTAAAWHALVLLEFSKIHPEFDNRPRKV